MRGVRAAGLSSSRPEQMEYALTGAWLDKLPPSRPDGVWQLHAAWLEPGEELEVEPEFDAVLARLAATPMPNPPKYHVMRRNLGAYLLTYLYLPTYQTYPYLTD